MDIPPVYASRVQVTESGCWIWTGWVNHPRRKFGSEAAYGVLQRNNKRLPAHRYFYQLATGADLGDLVVHHKCPNTQCVNPDHLEAIPRSEHQKLHDDSNPWNNAFRTRPTCSRGHPWTEASTRYTASAARRCRICLRDNMRQSRAARGLVRKEITHCPSGHPYSGDNLAILPNGHRRCRACNREQYHRRKKRLQQG